MKTPTADFGVQLEGNIVLLHPYTQTARDWFNDNIPEDAQYVADALVVEHRYAMDVIFAMLNAGMKGKNS